MSLEEQERVLKLIVQDLDRIRWAMDFVFNVMMEMPEFAERYNEAVIRAQEQQKRPPIMRNPDRG